jgi:3-hydroxyacyl-CoA dehydrogenase
MDFVRVLGKTGVEVFEYPGYVTTRVILPFLNEAMHVVMEGVATPEAVDTSMKLGYGLPVGFFALADRIGLDEVSRWMQYFFEELGDLIPPPSSGMIGPPPRGEVGRASMRHGLRAVARSPCRSRPAPPSARRT